MGGGKKSGNTSHWATKDLLAVLLAAVLVLGIIAVWTPQIFARIGNVVALPVTLRSACSRAVGVPPSGEALHGPSQSSGSLFLGEKAVIMRNLSLGPVLLPFR